MYAHEIPDITNASKAEVKDIMAECVNDRALACKVLFPERFERVSVTADDNGEIEHEEDTITPLQPESAKGLLLKLYQKFQIHYILQ